MTTLLIMALGAFAGGFLLADRRAVRQCNAILEENWRDLMKAMLEEKPLIEPLAGEEQPARQTVH